MRRWVSYALVIGLVAAAAGFAVTWSGIVSIAASSGHWPITEWFLHFAMRQSVKTHSSSIDPPPLDDPRLMRRGAGHYAAGCAPCHGAPGVERAAVARGMTPVPPYLPHSVESWDAAELFWIVRHGVKFTGMPAWTAQTREDEVWAVVAFLRAMPRFDEAEYRRLAFGESDRQWDSHGAGLGEGGLSELSPPVEANCARCHGTDGGTENGTFPQLGGQNEAYLYATLRAFADGKRFSGIMQAAVAGLDDARLRALARHYATAAPRKEAPPDDGPASPAGERLARSGAPDQGVPPCAACHGLGDGPRHDRYPSLTGQPAGYIASQLELFRKDARGGTSYAHIMRTIAQRLDGKQREAVARYYESLQPSRAEAR